MPFNTLQTHRTEAGCPGSPLTRLYPGQGEAGGIKGAGILRWRVLEVKLDGLSSPFEGIAMLLCAHIQMQLDDDMTDQTSNAPKFDPDNPLPYGGTTDIHGNIIQAITKEEQDAMLAKVRRAFGKKR